MTSRVLNFLLVDDDREDQEIFCMALEDTGKKVRCIYASDGADALKQLREEMLIPDFIFIDMNMPRMSGNQCLAEIKKIQHLVKVPVYMYSTAADHQAIAEAKEIGAAGYIVKPGKVSELTETLLFTLNHSL